MKRNLLYRLITNREHQSSIHINFPEVICKDDYKRFLGLSKQSKLSLEQGKFLRSRRLAELNMKLSDKVTPGDGSCMFHAILDQILNIPSLQDYASSQFELRWKIVSDGYKSFLETDNLEWPNDPMCGSKQKWKTEMLDPKTS